MVGALKNSLGRRRIGTCLEGKIPILLLKASIWLKEKVVTKIALLLRRSPKSLVFLLLEGPGLDILERNKCIFVTHKRVDASLNPGSIINTQTTTLTLVHASHKYENRTRTSRPSVKLMAPVSRP